MKPLPARSNIVLFYALPQVHSPFTRSSKSPLLNVAFIHEIGCQKKPKKTFRPLGHLGRAVGIISLPIRIYYPIGGVSAASDKGLTSNGRLTFSPPPPHGDTPSLRISFTSQTLQKSQRLHSTSPFLSMTKTLFFSSRRRSCYQCMPFSHSGGQVLLNNR